MSSHRKLLDKAPERDADGRASVFRFDPDCDCEGCQTMRAQAESYVRCTLHQLGERLSEASGLRRVYLADGAMQALDNWDPEGPAQ